MKFLSFKIQDRNSLAIQCLGLCFHRLDLWWENEASHAASNSEKERKKERKKTTVFSSCFSWRALNKGSGLGLSLPDFTGLARNLATSCSKVQWELNRDRSVGSWGLWGAAWPKLGRSETNFWEGERCAESWRTTGFTRIEVFQPTFHPEQTQKPKASQRGHVLIEE